MPATVRVPHLTEADSLAATRRGMTAAARIGYLTYGLVYGMTGALALLSALGQGGDVTDKQGAVRDIGALSHGKLLLWPVAVGLACYTLWNLVRALLDPERRAQNIAGKVVNRFAYAISAVIHGLLSAYTFALANGTPPSGHGGSSSGIARALALPGGRVLLAVIGVCVVGFGMHELYRGIKDKVSQEYNGTVPPHRDLMHGIARVGHAARGVVFVIVGSSISVAAVQASAAEAGSFSGALRKIASQPFGSVLLGLVATGLVAFGVHQLCLARYARIPQPHAARA
jgi:hypothetical protein